LILEKMAGKLRGLEWNIGNGTTGEEKEKANPPDANEATAGLTPDWTTIVKNTQREIARVVT
jgi:hypothetical protein